MSTQKKIRDIERLIKKKDRQNPSDPIIEELKLKLQSLHDERKMNLQHEKEKKMSTKYHMVKFFERRKLTRKIFQSEKSIKKLQNSQNKPNEIKQKIDELTKYIDELKDKLTYVLYYPKTMKYISLFGEVKKNDLVTLNGKQKKILELAKGARQQAIENNEEDRVEHAIQVERDGNASGKNRKKQRIQLDGDEDAEDNDLEYDMEEEEDDDDDDENDSESQDRNDKNQVESDESSSESESESEEDETKENASNSSDDEEEKEKETKTTVSPAVSKSPRQPTVTPSSGNATDYQPDPFFLEEADGDTTGIVEETPMRQQRFAKRGGMSYKRDNRRDPSKPLSKQESRLRNWQSGVRGGRGGGRSRGRGDERTSNHHSTDESSSNKPFHSKRKFEDDESQKPNKQTRIDGRNRSNGDLGSENPGRGRGAGRGFDRGRGRNNDRGRGRGRGEISQSRSAWEEGGGVSALSVTERTKQKLSGAIVATGTGKKITFDD